MATSRGVFACFGKKEERPILSTNISEVEQSIINGYSVSKKEDEFRRIFNVFDADGDGLITSSELSSCLRAMGIDPMQEEEDLAKLQLCGNGSFELGMLIKIYRLFKLNDIDDDGYVDFDEVKMNLVISDQEMKQTRGLWDWITTIWKKMGLGKASKNEPTSVIIKRKKY